MGRESRTGGADAVGRAVRGGRRSVLRLPLAGMDVPALLLHPATGGRAPAVLLLHGYGSRKERMSDTVGCALLDNGVASLAVDLPLHGEREASVDEDARRNPLAIVAQWRAAQAECREALEWLAGRDDVDSGRIGLAGYSMGAFLGVTVAARSPHVGALVLAAGGDLPPRTPFAELIRTVADPLRAVRALGGRPLLMVHGERDRTVRPEQAHTLFAAAGEPKEIRWYDAGHWLPDPVIRDAARWLADRLGGEARPAR